MKKEKKNTTIFFTGLIIIILLVFVSIFVYFKFCKDNKNEANDEDAEELMEDDIIEASVKPFDNEETIILNINGFNYGMVLENNQSAYDLFSVLPLELNMDDLNNNEKYAYLSFSLAQEDSYTGHISKGDVMLYQSNCIVIFYDDFDTDYLYTKLGHIYDLNDLGNGPIKVIIQ